MNGHLFTIVIQLTRLDLGVNAVLVQLGLNLNSKSRHRKHKFMSVMPAYLYSINRWFVLAHTLNLNSTTSPSFIT